MNLPDFLIVGAAKAGTTSLYKYLGQHPAVFFPKIKEPKFFVSTFLDLPQNGTGDHVTEEHMVKNFNEYEKLFESKLPGQICGEASVDYLYYSKLVIPQIKQLIGDPKVIIVLRNPVKRAYSAYRHMVRDVRESLSFKEALKHESQRKEDNYEFIWYYKDCGLYYNDVKNYLDSFTNVKVVLFEDFKERQDDVLTDIYSFLEIDTSFKANTQNIYNATGVPKNKKLQKLLKGSPNQRIRKTLKILLNEKTRDFVRHQLESINLSSSIQPMDTEIEKELQEFFKEDWEKTLKLLDKKQSL